MRESILGPDATVGAWNTATVSETHDRFAREKFVVQALSMGMIRDWEHLKVVLQTPI
jgi:hypothetical protein